MTTKERERKVLNEIEQLVLGLGTDSYVAKAFEGCFEIAKTNIDNDWMLSMKAKAETCEEALADATKTIQNRDAEIAREKNKVAQLEEDYNELMDRLHKTEDEASKIIDERMAYSTKCEQQEDEILRLKAKLYDLICK